jgi:hypothetical protein
MQLNNLIFKRKKRQPIDEKGETVVKISAIAYNKALEVADETGETIKAIVSKMVEYAYENVSYESEE